MEVMEKTNLLLVYLGILLVLLGVAAVLILRQVLKTRRIESTLSRLQAKLSKDKGTAQEYYELGSLLVDKRLYGQATTYLQQSLKALENELENELDNEAVEEDADEKAAAANLAIVYNALGFAYSAQEQYDLAIRQYKESVKLAPAYATALNNLGFCYERKQLTTQALAAYEQALAAEPKNATAKRRATSLRKRLGDPAPASEGES
jgi:tetratricopeptide (TPR) repeat protein